MRPARELHKNRATTILSGAVDDEQTTVTVDDGSALHATGNFRLMCESEILICTARSSDTLTVIRGQDGTTATAHADATTVSMIYSVEGLGQIFRDHDPLFGYSGRPVMGGIYADNGIDTLTSSDFTWQNQNGATVTDRGGTMLMRVPTSATFATSVLELPTPSPPYSYIAALRCAVLLDSDSSPCFGIGFRESSSGKAMIIRMLSQNFFQTSDRVSVTRCTNLTSAFTSTVAATPFLHVGKHLWMKVENDGTNTKYYVSSDGVEWLLLLSEGKHTYFDSEPDRVFWYGNNAGNSGGGGGSPLATEMLVELSTWSRGE